MNTDKPTADAELESLQREAFSYFLHWTNPHNGLVLPRTDGNIVTDTTTSMPGRCSRTSSPTSGSTFAVSRTPSCVRKASTISRTAGARPTSKASFNPTYPVPCCNPHGWVSPWHFGLNEGPTILMIENYRTGSLWQLMRGCPYIADGLRRAGFKGGWL